MYPTPLSNALLPYLALVVGLAFLLLMLVFRSVLVPLKATVGFLLSVAATFGAVGRRVPVGLAQPPARCGRARAHHEPLADPAGGYPLWDSRWTTRSSLAIRMREDFVHGATARDAVITGFRHSARVVNLRRRSS